jgi:hypothetical protein
MFPSRDRKTFSGMGDGRTSNSNDMMLQHHDARTPANSRANNIRNTCNSTDAATAFIMTRAWITVTVRTKTEETPLQQHGASNRMDKRKSMVASNRGPTREETPAIAWVSSTARTRARPWTRQ